MRWDLEFGSLTGSNNTIDCMHVKWDGGLGLKLALKCIVRDNWINERFQ